jgi:DNA-binding IscR family transcriptional regulator
VAAWIAAGWGKDRFLTQEGCAETGCIAGSLTVRRMASGAVVRRIEDLALVTCFEGGSCLIASACMLQTALREALAAFLAVLDRCALADLASSPALVRLLETA